jgi:hypothetical protein
MEGLNRIRILAERYGHILPDEAARAEVFQELGALHDAVERGWQTIPPLQHELAAAAPAAVPFGPVSVASAHEAILIMASELLLWNVWRDRNPKREMELVQLAEKKEIDPRIVALYRAEPTYVMAEDAWPQVVNWLNAVQPYYPLDLSRLTRLRAACVQESARATQAVPIRGPEHDTSSGLVEVATDGEVTNKKRIYCDPDTHIITLDGVEYPIPNPKAFLLYQILSEARGEPTTRRKLRQRNPTFRGDKTVRRLADSLPPELRDTIQSGPAGFWLRLPNKN